MAQAINTNLASINTQRHLNMSQASLRTSLERLSSGLRINSARDDAAGNAIATRMDSLVRGMAVAQRNASDGISMYQTAESAVGKISDAMSRMRELSVQAANGTPELQRPRKHRPEFVQLQKEIVRIVSGTTFNGLALRQRRRPQHLRRHHHLPGRRRSLRRQRHHRLRQGRYQLDRHRRHRRHRRPRHQFRHLAAFPEFLDPACRSPPACAGTVPSRTVSNRSSPAQVAAENQTAARSRIVDADFCRRNRQPDPLANPAAGRLRHAVPGQCPAAERLVAAPRLSGRVSLVIRQAPPALAVPQERKCPYNL